MANFVTQHCGMTGTLEIVPWTLFFDGSTCDRGAGIGIVLISLREGSMSSLCRLLPRQQIIKLNIKL